MNGKKGNAIAVIFVIMLILALILGLTKFTAKKSLQTDNTHQAVIESDIAVRKSVFDGVGIAMRNGLSMSDNRWYCNKPFPPDVVEANRSLEHFTNNLLSTYLNSLREIGYYEEFENLTYHIEFPEEDTAEAKIPGHVVIVTDLSGSMKTSMSSMDNRRKDDVVRELNKRAVKRILEKTPGAKVGLVTYSEGGHIVQGLTDNLVTLYNTINIMAAPEFGGTCIACGIYRAVELLIPPPVPDILPIRPLTIILMSDGGANYCNDLNTIDEECRVLTDLTGNGAVDRNSAKSQAKAYATEAFSKYKIKIYTVVFKSDPAVCIAHNWDPIDCYDPNTMDQIAKNAGGKFGEADNSVELARIYDEFADAASRYALADYKYLRLENDLINVKSPLVISGLNLETLKTKQNISDGYIWPFRAWYLYKHLVNWLIVYGNGVVEMNHIKDVLTAGKPCQGVLNIGGGCPSQEDIDNFISKMKLKNKHLRPLFIQRDIEKSLNSYLNETNITCTTRYLTFNVSNYPIFEYHSSAGGFQVNNPFGSGVYRQTGDGTTPRVNCPETDTPDGRTDFLKVGCPYKVGSLGNPANNPQCSTSYQYIGMDRTLKYDLLVSCQEPTIGAITDGRYTFEPLTIEFVISLDMMSDCDPPGSHESPPSC